MNPIKCFMLNRTDTAFRWLRRYKSGTNCPHKVEGMARGYCCAMVRIEDGTVQEEEAADGRSVTVPGVSESTRKVYKTEPGEWPHDDPRWPKKCACGYEFADGDHWQLFWGCAYRDDAGKLFSIHSSQLPGVDRAPAGAMWWAEWWPEKAPDGGHCLNVRVPRNPDGSGVSDWMPDGPSLSSPAPAWSRTGTPPNVTANPSIFVCPPTGFHGWLRDGVLTSCRNQ